MKTIHVARAFELVLDDQSIKKFPKGAIKVDDDIANHWFVKAHLEEPAKPAPTSEQPKPRSGKGKAKS